MDEEYDVIVLGTGLKECILSGLLSVDGLKVLHLERNDYYGGESSSLRLTQLWKRFRGNDNPPRNIGLCKEYNVDMIPKMEVVYNKGKIYKVPATDVEALKSRLIGLFEKHRARKFFIYVQDYEENDPKSHEGLDLNKVTARELISKYGLEDDTINFIGHALALHIDDSYLDGPAKDFLQRMKSLARFQGGSPYIYPLYGLGELPQAFARLSAVYGGTYMLNKPQCKVEFEKKGKAIGVTSEGETAKCKKVVCDPSYLPDKVRKDLVPDSRCGCRYLFCCSYAHIVAAKGKYIAFVLMEAETDQPEVELKSWTMKQVICQIMEISEPVYLKIFYHLKIYSYDATTHLETTVKDVIAIDSKITGKDLDLSVDLSAATE
ncbi:Guanosine nucleotide diphosphate dissociation inhibitor [Quillaja saponaria]|uniref:Guanosine nucleotide diphosphate dissociation inhibitor n=1 Tax=Quillaja saponaria TaxID=32244 RepID=A0AAD7M1N0_QUISA|nr:Guanosine nucleotide diphosphate dissociation inhibitor [Quillaja saponaria]